MLGFNKDKLGTAGNFPYIEEIRIIDGKKVKVKVYKSQADRMIDIINSKNQAAPTCGKASFNN